MKVELVAKPGPPPSREGREAEMARRAAAGDAAAFGELIEMHAPTLVRIAYRILGSAEEARDAVQEAGLSAWKARGRLDPSRPYGPYIRRTVVNKSRDMLRRRRPTAQLHESPDARPGPHAHAEARDEAAAALAALDRLTETERVVFTLRILEELPTREVAEVIGATPETVRSHLSRARAKLREALA